MTLRRPLTALGAAVRACARLAPTFAAATLLAQIAVLGLGPARAEAARLDREARELDARLEELRVERRALDRRLRALADPVYRARVERAFHRGRAGAGGPGADAPLELPLGGAEAPLAPAARTPAPDATPARAS